MIMKKTIMSSVCYIFVFITLCTQTTHQTITDLISQNMQTTLSNLPQKLSPTQTHLLYFIKDHKKNFWYKLKTSPSIANIYHLLTKNAFKDFVSLVKNEKINRIINQVFESEIALSQQSYFFAYHATQSSFYALQYIDTTLLRLEQELLYNNIVPRNILKLRQPLAEKDILARHKPAFLPRQAKKRRTYIKHGIILGNDAQKHHRKYLLSCNWSLTGNLLRPTSSTLQYFAQNFNKYTPPFNYDYICNQYIFAHYTKRFIPVFKKSFSKLINKTNHGILLQLIFKDKNLFRDTAYLSAPGGQKYQPENLKRKIFASIETPDIFLQKISHKNNSLPYQFASLDYQQLRIILTHDKLLDIANPKIYNNFKVHAYSTNQKALDEFHREIDLIMKQIKTEYLADQK